MKKPAASQVVISANPYLLLSLAALFWSGNHIIGRAVAGLIPPFTIATFRWLLPLIVLWPFARKYVMRDLPKLKQHWKTLLFAGLTGGAIFGAGQYVGLQLTTALNVSVLNSITPVAIVAVSGLLFRERLAAVQALGILISLLGVLLIITRADFNVLRTMDFNFGDIIIFVNMILFAFYSVVLRKAPPLHWLTFTFVMAAISSAALLPFSLWEIASGQVFTINLWTILSLLYFAIFTSVVAFVCWQQGIAMIGANRGGPFLHLIPIYTAVMASAFLGERLLFYHFAGFVLILLGVWAASREQKPAPAAKTARNPKRGTSRR